MIEFLTIILGILLFIVTDRICGSFTARYCAKKCNYNCKECGMWSCTNETDHENYKIPPYDNFKNVCGKEKKEKENV